MEFFPTSKTFLSIGAFSVQWYAVCILIGALLAYKIAQRDFVKAGYTKEMTSDLLTGVLLTGIIGARIWYVVFMFDELYKDNLWDMFKITNGGLAIQGGIVAGIAFCAWYLKKHDVPFLMAGDFIMPNLLLSQACGRWGNFINQEAHGGEVTRQFLEGLHLPEFIINGMHINGTYYHPTFLYESVGNLIGFLLIYFILRKIIKTPGIAFCSYFVWYGIVRFFVEGMRTDSLYFMGIRTAQATSIVFLVVGLAGMVYCRYIYKKKPDCSV